MEKNYENERDSIGLREEISRLYVEAAKELNANPNRITSFDSQGILSGIPIGFAVGHAETGRFIFVNNAYATALGYTPPELEWNFRWYDLVYNSKSEAVVDGIQQQLNVYRTFGPSDVKTRRQWRHKQGHLVEGSVRYYGAMTSDIRGNPLPNEADVDATNGLPVVICMAEFDHYAAKRGVDETNGRGPYIDVASHQK